MLLSAHSPGLGPAAVSSGMGSVWSTGDSVTHTTELTFGPSDKAKPNPTDGKARGHRRVRETPRSCCGTACAEPSLGHAPVSCRCRSPRALGWSLRGDTGQSRQRAAPKRLVRSSRQHHAPTDSNAPEAGARLPALNVYDEKEFFRHWQISQADVPE